MSADDDYPFLSLIAEGHLYVQISLTHHFDMCLEARRALDEIQLLRTDVTNLLAQLADQQELDEPGRER